MEEEIDLNEFANNLVASYASREEGMVNVIASINSRNGTLKWDGDFELEAEIHDNNQLLLLHLLQLGRL